MQRRSFLGTSLAGLGSLGGFSGRLLAAPTGGSRMLLVFLRGGYDAMNLLVPISSSFYREVRPNIGLVRAAEGVRGALPLNADWGLHPVMETSLMPLVGKRQALFVPFAGTDDVSRSHFETQDSIELGQTLGATRDYGSGFMNRLAAQLQGKSAIAFTDQLPLVMRGSLDIANQSLKSLPKAGDAKLQKSLAAMYHDHPLENRVNEAFQVRSEVVREMAGEMQAASRNAIDAKGFELEARRIAKLMRERYSLGFVDIGGWDTHVTQGAATGYLAGRLEEVGRGLAAFANEMGEAAWRDTVVVVVSEFGRTLRENGNRGTDHGHGTVFWVLGGSLATGPVAGEQQTIEAGNLFQNRDLPVLNEYRGLLGGLMARQFGLGGAAMDKIFPGVRPRELGLI
jgi:uncharacterized protein (DUF1501 family)